MLNKRVCAVVVTYNRKELLLENIQALINQTFKIDKIIVIDNCSNDGTHEILEELCQKYTNVEFYTMTENVGGAGGFNEGLKIAYKTEYDYIWIMDDDTIPKENSLEKLILAGNLEIINDWGFLCSNVIWKDNTACVMNVPNCERIWNKHLINNLISVKSASFVSILIKRNIVKKIGYPIKEFFIWGDDVEYTLRISQKYKGYMVIDSNVMHKMANNNITDIISTDKSRLNRYFYSFRNGCFVSRKLGVKSAIKFYFNVIRTILKIILKKNPYKLKKISIVLKGVIYGIAFNPNVELPN